MATDLDPPRQRTRRDQTPDAKGALTGLRHDRALLGWLAPLSVVLASLLIRLYRLGEPGRLAFDETYYAKDGWSLANNGYVRDYPSEVDGVPINEAIEAGTTAGLWTDTPSLIVHPEVGKWLIGLGELGFGMDPFGWRISAAVAGSLLVLVMCRLLLRLTGSIALACIGGALLSLDGLAFVLSRLALLDIFLALFLTMAVACCVNDRYWMRAKLESSRASITSTWGPRLLWRPWLLLGGICFGLALGTKWTAAFPLAAFGLLVWFWSAGARRSILVRWPLLRSAIVDAVPAFGYLVVTAFIVYVATWSGWLANAAEYEESLSSTQYTRFEAAGGCTDEGEPDNELNEDKWPTATEPDATGLGEASQSLRSLWYYHQDVYTFHAYFLNCSEHNYESSPLGWPLLNRPVGIAAENDIAPGAQGCTAPSDSNCLRQVLALGNPLVWWAGVLALLYAVGRWLGARDWRFGLAVVGAASTWLPWLAYDDRPIFAFYAMAMLPFVVVALTLSLGRLLGSDHAATLRRTLGVIVVGSYMVLVFCTFAWFYPIWTNLLITNSQWLDRIWFDRWI